MFLVRRPSPEHIDRFLRESHVLPLSYSPTGIVRADTVRQDFDEATVAIGHGKAAFERARAALIAWKQFDIGWVETFPRAAPIAAGSVVVVLIHHFGFWSLTNHAESGEELFEVFIDPQTEDVIYRIRAISWPQALLARVGKPIARLLQACFRRDSAAAMKRATRGCQEALS